MKSVLRISFLPTMNPLHSKSRMYILLPTELHHPERQDLFVADDMF